MPQHVDTVSRTSTEPTSAVRITVIYSLGSLSFDAWLTEKHTSGLEVTTNPIETGVSIADHCYLKPKQITIEAAVSDLKMPSASTAYDDTSTSRSRRAYELLLQQQANATLGDPTALLTVVSSLYTYRNMICTSISANRDADTARLLSFEAELSEVITVSTQQASYTPLNPRAGKPTRQAGPAKGTGTVQTTPTTVVLPSKLASLIGWH